MVVDPDTIRRRIAAGEAVSPQDRQAAGVSDQETRELQSRNRTRLDDIAGRRVGGNGSSTVSSSSPVNATNSEMNFGQENPGEARLNELRSRLGNIAEAQSRNVGSPVNSTDRVGETKGYFNTAMEVQADAFTLMADYPELREPATGLINTAGELAAMFANSARWSISMDVASVAFEKKEQKNALPASNT